MTHYEWVIECYTDDEYQDITDVNYTNTDQLDYSIDDFFAPEGHKVRLALVRKIGNEVAGELDRMYAYVINDTLPVTFEDGVTIPKKYHKALSKFINK